MRYGHKYRYNSRKTSKFIPILITACVIVVLAATVGALFYFGVFPIRTKNTNSDAVSLQMYDGAPIEMTVKVGDVCMLTMPDAVDMREVVFESSDPAVVRVDAAGHTDALSAGTATVTAAARNFAAQCQFTVAADPEPEQPDEMTTAVKANEDIVAANRKKGTDNLYSLTVNRRTNTVTAYTYDDKGDYTVPVRAMVCSCGTGGNDITITGDFALYFHESWHQLYGDVYGMYVSGFQGPYLFHSVPYATAKHDTLKTEEFNKLGEHASQGCVRMMASDVYWIFKNCALNTPVHVIDADAKYDPLGKPAAVKLPADMKWDPTDKIKSNPYWGKGPTLTGAEDVTLTRGKVFDPMAGIAAADVCGNDLTDRVRLTGGIIDNKPGVYYLTYTVTDDFHLQTKVTRTVTVEE